jgi:hypothetical protein
VSHECKEPEGPRPPSQALSNHVPGPGLEAMAHKLMALDMVSIPIKNLDVLIRELVTQMKTEQIREPVTGYTSEELRLYFVRNEIFPPETYFDRNFFSAEKPRVTLTYMWPATPIEKFAELLKRRYTDEDTVYIDILLNDQRTQLSIQYSMVNANLRCFEFEFFVYSIQIDDMKVIHFKLTDT